MPRTTAVLVRKIKTDIPTGTDLDPFIEPANFLVTKLLSTAVVPGTTTLWYTNDGDGLTLIETWLAAHFNCVDDPRAASEKVGPITQRLQGKIDLGLDSSLYGQQAMRLDISGILSRYNNQAKTDDRPRLNVAGGVLWLGKTAEAEADRD